MIRIGRVSNENPELARETVEKLRKQAKAMGCRIRTYGRCRNKVEAFAQTGRPHRMGSNANSIYSLKSPEAKFVYEWAIYRTETKEEKELYEVIYSHNLKLWEMSKG